MWPWVSNSPPGACFSCVQGGWWWAASPRFTPSHGQSSPLPALTSEAGPSSHLSAEPLGRQMPPGPDCPLTTPPSSAFAQGTAGKLNRKYPKGGPPEGCVVGEMRPHLLSPRNRKVWLGPGPLPTASWGALHSFLSDGVCWGLGVWGSPVWFSDLGADTNSLLQEIPLQLRWQPGYLAASIPVSPLEFSLISLSGQAPGKDTKWIVKHLSSPLFLRNPLFHPWRNPVTPHPSPFHPWLVGTFSQVWMVVLNPRMKL